MIRRVVWSRDALDDLKQQLGWIAADDPIVAETVIDRLRTAAAQLGDFATGRPGRVPGTYEKSVARLPYIIAYALVSPGGTATVAILRVIHTARDWPEGHWPTD